MAIQDMAIQEVMPDGLPYVGSFTAADRCDRCGAQAYTETDSGLLFCAHHAHAYRDSITLVRDARDLLVSET